jgi:acyl-CoA thioester hydrolase
MTPFKFYHPIEVRYGDLDPQGHVNNSRYLTYFEQARVSYFRHLGYLHVGTSWMDYGFILAEARLTFLKPVQFGTDLRAGVRVIRLGNKSLTMENCLEDGQSGEAMCNGSAVLVAYDYRTTQTIPLPQHLRAAICAFEGMENDGETKVASTDR